DSTYISKSVPVWDVSADGNSFALGGTARNGSGKYFDCYMNPTFFTMAGEIKMWAGDTIPDGWLLCDGSEVSKTTYPNLYAAIGDLWGTPASSSNFVLPNLTGRVPVGYNSADTDTTETFGTVGATGGARGAWYHTHTIPSSGAHGHTNKYMADISGTQGTRDLPYSGGDKTQTSMIVSSGAHTHTINSSGSSGNQIAVDKANMPPYAVIKYIICAI
ncbi:MAG: phage tail protein, partial [Phocaeicola sp.]